MLYLYRKIGECIIINGNIELSVVGLSGYSVRLGLTYPDDTTISRRAKSAPQDALALPLPKRHREKPTPKR